MVDYLDVKTPVARAAEQTDPALDVGPADFDQEWTGKINAGRHKGCEARFGWSSEWRERRHQLVRGRCILVAAYDAVRQYFFACGFPRWMWYFLFATRRRVARPPTWDSSWECRWARSSSVMR